MAIIYLHGFASVGESPKSEALRAYFPHQRVVAPNLPVQPSEATAAIEQLVQKLYTEGETKFLFVGTSLGGFYAWWASARFHAPAIIVNPAHRPHISTRRYLGGNKNYGSGQTFQWQDRDIEQLKVLQSWVEHNADPHLIHCVVALDDAVLNAADILDYFKEKGSIQAFDQGGHRFDGFERLMPIIDRIHKTIRHRRDPIL